MIFHTRKRTIMMRLEGDACCSVHCKQYFVGKKDDDTSLCVADTVFGEVGR